MVDNAELLFIKEKEFYLVIIFYQKIFHPINMRSCRTFENLLCKLSCAVYERHPEAVIKTKLPVWVPIKGINHTVF